MSPWQELFVPPWTLAAQTVTAQKTSPFRLTSSEGVPLCSTPICFDRDVISKDSSLPGARCNARIPKLLLLITRSQGLGEALIDSVFYNP